MYDSDSIVQVHTVRAHWNEGGLGLNHLLDEVVHDVSDIEGVEPAMSYSLKL